MAFLHAQTNQQPIVPLHLLPSPPPCTGGSLPGNHHLITLDLFHVSAAPSTPNFHLQLLQNYYSPLSFTFDHNFLKVGESLESSRKGQDSEEESTKMSRRNGPKLDLKLNLSPPRRNPHVATPSRSATVSPTSPPSSCVSSEEDGRYSSSPEAASMVLVGCPRCLMYVMLSEEDPRCPKCKSTVLLDVLQDHNNNSTSINTTKKSKN